MKKILHCVLIIALLTGVSGCAQLDPYIPAVKNVADTITQLKNRLSPLKQTSRNDSLDTNLALSTEADQYLDKIFHKLVEASGEKNFYSLYFSSNPMTQGQAADVFGLIHILVTRGMLNVMQDESEFACLIGHEIGHIALNHSKRREKGNPFNPIIGQITDKVLPVGKAKKMIMDQEQKLLNFQWSRAMEQEADFYGMDLAVKTGYDPYALCRLFDRFAGFNKNKNLIYKIKKLGVSHYSYEKRAQACYGYAESKRYPKKVLVEGANTFQNILYSSLTKGYGSEDSYQKYNDSLERINFDLNNALSTHRAIELSRFFEIMSKLSEIAQQIKLQESELIPLAARGATFLDEGYIVDKPWWATKEMSRQELISKFKESLNLVAQLAVGSIPAVGNAISLYEALTGKDAFSGKQLSFAERTIDVLCVFIGSGKAWKSVAMGIEKEIGQKTLARSIDSVEEIEIRANTIYVCELIRERLAEIGRIINSNDLDWLLWSLSEEYKSRMPYHKTITTNY